MAINYPTSLDTFTNPTATDLLTSPSHAQQHADINDAMEAVQTKLAIGNTVLGTYTAYTPTWTNLTVGNGIQNFKYARVNNLVHFFGYLKWGSTTAITSSFVNISLPVNSSSVYSATNFTPYGTGVFFDASIGLVQLAQGVSVGAIEARLRSVVVSGTNVVNNNITSTAPFTWTTNDQIAINFTYEAA